MNVAGRLELVRPGARPGPAGASLVDGLAPVCIEGRPTAVASAKVTSHDLAKPKRLDSRKTLLAWESDHSTERCGLGGTGSSFGIRPVWATGRP